MANVKLVGAVVAAILVVFGLTFGIMGMKTVDSGFRGVLKKNFGEVETGYSLGEGMHIVNIAAGEDVIPVDVRTQKVTADANSGTLDLQSVSAEVAVNIRLDPNRVQTIYKNVGLGYQTSIVAPAIQEAVKAVTAKFKAEQLITQREMVKDQIEEYLKGILAPYGIIVDGVFITNFNFSPEFDQAVEAKVKADQDALRAQNVLKTVEAEAQQAKAKAEGERDARIAQAQGEAQYKALTSQAEADAIAKIDNALADNPHYIEYLKAQRWDGRLPTFVGSGNLPFIMNLEDLKAQPN